MSKGTVSDYYRQQCTWCASPKDFEALFDKAQNAAEEELCLLYMDRMEAFKGDAKARKRVKARLEQTR